MAKVVLQKTKSSRTDIGESRLYFIIGLCDERNVRICESMIEELNAKFTFIRFGIDTTETVSIAFNLPVLSDPEYVTTVAQVSVYFQERLDHYNITYPLIYE